MRRLALALAITLVAPLSLVAQQQKTKVKEKRSAQQQQPPDTVPMDTLVVPQALKARSIGPAVMGGRVAALAFNPKEPTTYYVGLGTGGIMKTTNDGQTFSDIFTREGVASIGTIAVAPSDPEVVWVGTGEGNDRNTSSWGNGVHRSTDGGATWSSVGLPNSKSIPRIAVHPTDPKTAWVSVLGDLWTPSAERGLYKTTDAGATWKLVLSAPAPYGDRVGAGDVMVDPTDPNIVYATLYARRRTPWSFVSGVQATDGKDLGGIFKSIDGGATWKKLTKGLPARTQRIGLAMYAKIPKVLYAVVQSDAEGNSGLDDIMSKAGGVFRSDDGGESWTRMSKLNPRPFYFSQIRVDPSNDQRIYVLGFMLHVSEDGGKSWREDRFKNVHADNHALIIDPSNPKHVVLGTDGGVYQSYDAGAGWEHLARFAGGEYFRVQVDMSTPYRICGGLQDNSSWVGPSRTYTKDLITNGDWIQLGGGDGGWCAFDPTDSSMIYVESQQGYLQRTNIANGEIKNLRPEPTEGGTEYRFHWTSPFVVSTHEKGALYYGGTHVFKYTNHGDSWKVISPDFSSHEYEKIATVGSGAEDYGVIYALAESPKKAGELWVGTDDGRLFKTEDDGASWSDLTPNLPAVARKGGHGGEPLWISMIVPSAHDENVAYLTLTGYKVGVYAPYIFRTADGGKSWQSIASNLPENGPVKSLVEDPTNPKLLFAGTEFGLWATLDGGAHWQRFGGLPTVAVDHLVIHPRDRDLIIATHGRSLYVVDDIRALEELTPSVWSEPAHLFPIRPVTARYTLPGWQDSGGDGQFRGENPPDGALITFYVRRFTGTPVKISITGPDSVPVANLTGPSAPGISRVNWDLRPTKDLLTEYGGVGSDLFVKAGEYTVTLTYGDVKQTQKLEVDVAPGITTR